MIRRYDVLPNPVRRRGDPFELVVVLSSPHLLSIEVAIVAPLVKPELAAPDGKLNIAVSLDGSLLTACIPLLTSVELRRLGRALGTLLEHSDDLDRAVDRLFSGF